MNQKEVSELRRRLKPEKCNITALRGCYVNENNQIVTEFHPSLQLMGQEESENILAILKRTLSGSLGKNLIDISFTTAQVMDSPEHRLLMSLRNSSLEDEQAVHSFYEKVISTLSLEGGYLILLACDKYDLPFRRDEEDEEISAQVYSYLLCAICPIKTTKPALSYYVSENTFHNSSSQWLVGPPELGFLFPAFDDRSTNLYGALYYTRSAQESHTDFTDVIFQRPVPMPAAAQQEAFQVILQESLGEECSLGLVESVQDCLCQMIARHKEEKDPEPLELSPETVGEVLGFCGASPACQEAVRERCRETFGPAAQLSPQNLMDTKKLQLTTPDVTIQVNPQRGDLVEARILDGKKYILIRAEEGVALNGVNLCFPSEAAGEE